MLKFQCINSMIKNVFSTQKSSSFSLVRQLCNEIKNEQQNQTGNTENVINSSEDSISIDDKNDSKANDTVKLSGFAKAFDKFNEPEPQIVEKEKTFAALLRHSTFIDLGDPQGKVVSGKIFHVVDDDLYIDFGWKFYCVCTRPFKNGKNYVLGSTVKLQIKELELSSLFLGATKDLTVLEADCTLLGLIDTPMNNINLKKL